MPAYPAAACGAWLAGGFGICRFTLRRVAVTGIVPVRMRWGGDQIKKTAWTSMTSDRFRFTPLFLSLLRRRSGRRRRCSRSCRCRRCSRCRCRLRRRRRGRAGAGAAFSAGFCSSAFLQPTTAIDNVTKKSRERINCKYLLHQHVLLSQIFERSIAPRVHGRR